MAINRHRMFGDSVIPLPHIYGARIKGVEVFCPLDPPPPYEAVAAGENQPLQVYIKTPQSFMQVNILRHKVVLITKHTFNTIPTSSKRPHKQCLRRSNSDPVLLDLTAKVMSCEAATQTEVSSGTGPAEQATVTLRRGKGPRRPRPSSLVDYQSYRDTKLLVARFLQQSSCSLTPEVQELINNIKTVLQSDEEHMEEAVRCASFIDQVRPQPDYTSITLPLRKRPGLLHLRSCGDLSTFTWAELSRPGSRTGSRRLGQERPHSLIGVSRETVL
uniref:Family with sequence similarity 189 member A2 n=1 Tax=Astyanax mexicanus TaxID=7994 RepID=A0A8B9JF31_ASTMX